MQFFDVFYLITNEVSQIPETLMICKQTLYKPMNRHVICTICKLSTNHDTTHRIEGSLFWMFLSFLLQTGKCNSHFRASPAKFFSDTKGGG